MKFAFHRRFRYSGASYDRVDRLSPDAETLALYHFDEGSADQIHDASGHQQHGRVVGAEWVRLP